MLRNHLLKSRWFRFLPTGNFCIQFSTSYLHGHALVLFEVLQHSFHEQLWNILYPSSCRQVSGSGSHLPGEQALGHISKGNYLPG